MIPSAPAATALFENLTALAFDMIRETDRPFADDLAQSLLALVERKAAQILAVERQQIEGEKDDLACLMALQRGNEARKIADAFGVEHDRFAVDQGAAAIELLRGGGQT